MVREVIISVATLAGLAGLATLYSGSNSLTQSRMARSAVDIADFGLQDDMDTDYFATDFGMDDVDMFQNDPRAGGAKKQIPQVKNCMKNPKCIVKAQKAVASWSTNAKQYIESNPSRLLKAVNTGYEESENDLGLCTPNDDGLNCDANADNLAFYRASDDNDYKQSYSTNAAVQALVEENAASSAMQAANSGLAGDNPRAEGNPFKRRAAKIFLIIPNGVPVHMPESYSYRFGNYWRWFKAFNTKYIGVGTPGGANRVNFHFWFMRQDKNLKVIMKNPAKSTNRFPWRRFDSIMLPNQNTAAQPKMAATYQSLWETIDSKGLASEFAEGQDCFTLWFHQYIPADVLDLSDSLFQEEYMANLEKACTIIHVWVGMESLEEDPNTVKVVQYIQGLLQPEQLGATSADAQRRRYYFVKDLQSLMGAQGDRLMDAIYTDILFERSRATCLLATGASDLGAAFEAANDRYDEYYGYGDDSTTTTNNYAVNTYASDLEYDVEYDQATTYAASYDNETTAADLGEPDYKCCGIGFAGRRYDANNEACCDDGSIAASEADCFLL